jgi:hypothetical protein
MRRGSAILLNRLRSSARAEPIAWIVVLTVLMQTLLGAPMALRMAADASWASSLDPELALCAATHDSGTPDEPAKAPVPATHHHEHDHCTVCYGALGPLLLAAVWIIGTPEPLRVPAIPYPPSEKPEERPTLAYTSRAPPANA